MLAAAMRPLVVVALAVCAGCSRPSGRAPVGLESRDAIPTATRSTYQVRYDQLGYLPDPESERYALLLSAGGSAAHYHIVEASTKRVLVDGVAGPRPPGAGRRRGPPPSPGPVRPGELTLRSLLRSRCATRPTGPLRHPPRGVRR